MTETITHISPQPPPVPPPARSPRPAPLARTTTPRPTESSRPTPPPPPSPPPTSPGRSSSVSSAPAEATSTTEDTAPATVTIRAWVDPLVDEAGHDPRSRYVEQFWLGVLGPTATWLLRRLVAGLERHPDGYEIDLAVTARSMGMSYSVGRSSPFAKALDRCTMFGLAHQTSDGLAIRRRVPTVAHRHLRRMPPVVQREHAIWQEAPITLDDLSRAHCLAMAMLDAGDDPSSIEHQLIAIGVSDPVASEVAENISRL